MKNQKPPPPGSDPLPDEVEFDPGRMLRMAVEFYEVGILCGGMPGMKPTRKWYAHPQVVNFAFAAELALKGLQVAFGVVHRPQGHDLRELFDALPPNVQDRIQGDSNTVLKAERLERVSHAFSIWRYAYEHGELAISIDFLQGIALTAIAVLRERVGERGQDSQP